MPENTGVSGILPFLLATTWLHKLAAQLSRENCKYSGIMYDIMIYCVSDAAANLW